MVLWRTEEHEPLSAREWDAAVARAAIEAIVADAEHAGPDGLWPQHPLDEVDKHEVFSSLYLGSAGVIWALSKLGGSYDCAGALVAALARYRGTPDLPAWAHAPSLLMGETGLLVVAELLGSPAAERGRLRELVHENRSNPTWELLWGSPGTILAARACGLEEEWRESAELLYAAWDESTDMWTHRADVAGRSAAQGRRVVSRHGRQRLRVPQAA